MHGTTFRALKVTCQVAAPGAESAVSDCLVGVVSSTAGWECYHYVTICCGSCRPNSDVALAIIALATCGLCSWETVVIWACCHYVTTCCGSCRPSSDVALAIISLATCGLYSWETAVIWACCHYVTICCGSCRRNSDLFNNFTYLTSPETGLQSI